MNSLKFTHSLLVIIAVILFIYTGYSFYKDAKVEKIRQEYEYALLHEPDPLVVERVVGDSAASTCINREYEFRRLVKATKSLDIYVQERWHSLDGALNTDGIEGEIVLAKPIYYPLDAGFKKVMTFKKVVPESVTKGRWEYRPIATYVVNEKKRITRALPPQIVDVDCNFDKTKHRGNLE
jgi:hypothetical protein